MTLAGAIALEVVAQQTDGLSSVGNWYYQLLEQLQVLMWFTVETSHTQHDQSRIDRERSSHASASNGCVVNQSMTRL